VILFCSQGIQTNAALEGQGGACSNQLLFSPFLTFFTKIKWKLGFANTFQGLYPGATRRMGGIIIKQTIQAGHQITVNFTIFINEF
jgi:hypothetical protein